MSETIAIIGCGPVGRGWAILFALAGREVRLYDALPSRGEDALALIRDTLADLAAEGLCDGPDAAFELFRVVRTLEEAVENADWIQESIPERLELKVELFAALDRLAPPEAIIGSSTSALSPDLFMKDLAHAARCLIVHPCNPPYLMPAVEVVPSQSTAPEVVEAAARILREIGQQPILLSRPVDGFVCARIQAALVNEAIHLVADGIVSPEGIELAVREALGLRWSFMGPFETMANNAPNGFADYAERLGPMYERVGRQMRVGEPWPTKAVAAIDSWYREKTRGSSGQLQQRWRDRRLMGLARHNAASESEAGPPSSHA